MAILPIAPGYSSRRKFAEAGRHKNGYLTVFYAKQLIHKYFAISVRCLLWRG
jgi:hypothetical protein